ncbi:MAG TPA: hypothetical protein VHW45_20910 [Candidatus Sulfotelmatobacter sp.]|nr:hypothetical protein [Candidatus Sulfotelmatobacter sp.]
MSRMMGDVILNTGEAGVKDLTATERFDAVEGKSFGACIWMVLFSSIGT